VDEKIKANLLLEADDAFNLLLDELLVLGFGDFALAELGTSLTDLLGLLKESISGILGEKKGETYREGTDGGGGELGELEGLSLDLLADSEGALAVKEVRGDSSDALADGVIRVGLEGTSLGDGDLVGLKGSSDLGDLGAREDSSNGGNLGSLLESEGEPVLLLLGQLLLRREGDGGVEERRRGANNDTVSTEGIDSLLAKLDGGGKAGLPDVTTGDETEGEDDGGGLDGSENFIKLAGSAVEIDMETGDGELGNEVKVGVETGEVSGEEDLGCDLAEGGIGSREL